MEVQACDLTQDSTKQSLYTVCENPRAPDKDDETSQTNLAPFLYAKVTTN